MQLDPKSTHKYALMVSVGLHLILLCCSLPVKAIEVDPEKLLLEVPIEMVMVKAKAPKKQKPIYKAATQKVKKRGIGAQSQKTATPPKKQPGDRETPGVKKSFSVIFPKEALNADLKGKVKVRFYINAQGRATRHKLLKSSGHDILDRAFIRTVTQYYVFKPKQRYGKKMNGDIVLSHEF